MRIILAFLVGFAVSVGMHLWFPRPVVISESVQVTRTGDTRATILSLASKEWIGYADLLDNPENLKSVSMSCSISTLNGLFDVECKYPLACDSLGQMAFQIGPDGKLVGRAEKITDFGINGTPPLCERTRR